MTFDELGILLEAKPFGEGDLIARFLTETHGLHPGLIKGGNSRRNRGSLEVGGLYQLSWRGRLSENLGGYTTELVSPLPSVQFMDDPDRLLALQSLAQVLSTTLTERDPVPELFAATKTWLDQLESELWVHTLAVIELRLLGLLGFGLDLSKCASTGSTENLAYVSPRSGRAVSHEAGEPYKDRLLVMPQFLIGQTADDFEQDGIHGLLLTGRFLFEWIYAAQNQDLPWSRRALIDRLSPPDPTNSIDTDAGQDATM